MHLTELSIVAHGAASLDRGELAALRQRAIPRFPALRPQWLKQSDEQTLAAVVALDRAIEQFSPAEPPDFSAWSIVSATRYLGRTVFAAVIDKYEIDGAWGVSVHGIPHCSPHALASSLSLVLASHGPCLGAAGVPGKELQAILTSAALLSRPDVSGLWLVLSGWSGVAAAGVAVADARCHAAALALVPAAAALRFAVPPVGKIVIGPASSKHKVSQPCDALFCLTSGSAEGLEINLFDGGLNAHLELCSLAALRGAHLSLPPEEGHGEGTPSCPPRPICDIGVKVQTYRPYVDALSEKEAARRLQLQPSSQTQ